MGIPESQLEIWTHPGATVTAQATHESIRSALADYPFPTNVQYCTYLQGSYRNSTNIRGDSDVDLVVEMTSAFSYDIDALDFNSIVRFRDAFSEADYSWSDFRLHVLQALRTHYGSSLIEEGHKSIRVLKGNSNRVKADVVVCLTHRKYSSFTQYNTPYYVEGIAFWALPEQRRIINYPKLHYENGTSKNGETNQRLRPTVRMFKNARSCMVERGIIGADVAPSYFIECLLYNMPPSRYDFTLGSRYMALLQWFLALSQGGKLGDLRFQNEQQLLFGTEPEQWQLTKALTFLQGLHTLWKDWR